MTADNSKLTNPANEPVLRYVEVEVRHDAKDSDTQIGDGEVG